MNDMTLKDQIQRDGFVAGLMQTRKGLDDGGDEGRHDPFMVGYRQGERVRRSIVDDAVREAVAEIDEQRRGA